MSSIIGHSIFHSISFVPELSYLFTYRIVKCLAKSVKNFSQNLTKSHPDLPESINEEKDEEDSPLGSGEINRAMSELEDVNPGTWSGRLPPTLPGLLSSSTGHFYFTTAKQRTSLDPHLRVDKVASPIHNNDGDDKSIKSECLPVKSFGEFNRVYTTLRNNE